MNARTKDRSSGYTDVARAYAEQDYGDSYLNALNCPAVSQKSLVTDDELEFGFPRVCSRLPMSSKAAISRFQLA